MTAREEYEKWTASQRPIHEKDYIPIVPVHYADAALAEADERARAAEYNFEVEHDALAQAEATIATLEEHEVGLAEEDIRRFNATIERLKDRCREHLAEADEKIAELQATVDGFPVKLVFQPVQIDESVDELICTKEKLAQAEATIERLTWMLDEVWRFDVRELPKREWLPDLERRWAERGGE